MSDVSGLPDLPVAKASPGDLMGKLPLCAHSVPALPGGGCGRVGRRPAGPGCGCHTPTCVSTLGARIPAPPAGEGPWLRMLSGVSADLLAWGLEAISATPTRYTVLFLSHPFPLSPSLTPRALQCRSLFARSSLLLILLSLCRCFPGLPWGKGRRCRGQGPFPLSLFLRPSRLVNKGVTVSVPFGSSSEVASLTPGAQPSRHVTVYI